MAVGVLGNGFCSVGKLGLEKPWLKSATKRVFLMEKGCKKKEVWLERAVKYN